MGISDLNRTATERFVAAQQFRDGGLVSSSAFLRAGALHGGLTGNRLVFPRMTHSAVRLVDIRDKPLSVDEVLGSLDDAASGGVVLFVGRVRDHDGGRSVHGLEYSAHPSALELLGRVCAALRRSSTFMGLQLFTGWAAWRSETSQWWLRRLLLIVAPPLRLRACSSTRSRQRFRSGRINSSATAPRSGSAHRSPQDFTSSKVPDRDCTNPSRSRRCLPIATRRATALPLTS